MLWFFLIALVHFYGFHFMNGALLLGLGDGTALGLLWQLAAPTIGAFITGWLLAAWVCFFKKNEPGHQGNR